MCDDSREITVNSPLFVAFYCVWKRCIYFLVVSFLITLYLLCMPIPLSLFENEQLYGTPFLLIWLLLFPFFKCYVWQFSQTFYEICFVALKFNLLLYGKLNLDVHIFMNGTSNRLFNLSLNFGA